MKSIWTRIPEQIRRLSIFVVLAFFLFFAVRKWLIPDDFGKQGHYRAGAVEDIIAQEMHYAGQDVCVQCHDDVGEEKAGSYHRNVSCEVCHGAALKHAEDPEAVKPKIQREREFCILCHEYLSSRPTGFPQIISASHNPIQPCVQCHSPHDPTPPETPSECSACHAEIARTKAVSHHIYVDCTVCHETPARHRENPRGFHASKPARREFCGQCHANEEKAAEGVKQIDLADHYNRYVCWQCHYPHLPEAK